MPHHKNPFDRRGVNPVKDLGLFMAYLRMIRKRKPDVVLTYTIKPNLYGGLAWLHQKSAVSVQCYRTWNGN